MQEIGPYINESNERNWNGNLTANEVRGIATSKVPDWARQKGYKNDIGLVPMVDAKMKKGSIFKASK